MQFVAQANSRSHLVTSSTAIVYPAVTNFQPCIIEVCYSSIHLFSCERSQGKGCFILVCWGCRLSGHRLPCRIFKGRDCRAVRVSFRVIQVT